MEKSALYHCSDSLYSYPLDDKNFRLVLKAKKDDFLRAEVLYNYSFSFGRNDRKLAYEEKRSDGVSDYFLFTIKHTETPISYVFLLEDQAGDKSFFTADGIREAYDPRKDGEDHFVIDFPNRSDIVRTNRKFADRIFYQIFPDRFFKAGEDASFPHWGKGRVSNGILYGGNLKGIREKIPYLKSLGVEGIYLNPIHPSDNAHRYNVFDYFSIDPVLGSKEDFKELIAALHENGMLLMMDLVFNHVGVENPLFLDVLKNGKASPYYHWFYIQGDYPDIRKRNYLSFGHARFMPKLDTNNTEVANYLLKVVTYYLKEFHVDGFRMDVAQDISKSFFRKMRERIKEIAPETFVLGEDWQLAPERVMDQEWDSLMNYPLKRAMFAFFLAKKKDPYALIDRLEALSLSYPEQSLPTLFNFLDSHDTARFITVSQNKQIYFAALGMLVFLPGIVSLYYGDEVLLEGKDDPDCRRCFPWEKVTDSNQDLCAVRTLLSFRSIPAVRKGKLSFALEGDLLLIRREDEKESYCYLFNAGEKPCPLPEGKKVLFGEKTLSPNTMAVIRER